MAMLLPRQKERENKDVGLVHQLMDSNVGKRKKKVSYLFPHYPPLSN